MQHSTQKNLLWYKMKKKGRKRIQVPKGIFCRTVFFVCLFFILCTFTVQAIVTFYSFLFLSVNCHAALQRQSSSCCLVLGFEYGAFLPLYWLLPKAIELLSIPLFNPSPGGAKNEFLPFLRSLVERDHNRLVLNFNLFSFSGQ